MKCYSNAFKKHWNNIGTICLNIILRTWNMFLHTRLTELQILFAIRSTVFSTSIVFEISRLVFFLIRRQSSEAVLWMSYFLWTPRKTLVKEHVFTRVASVWQCYRCFSRNLAKIYRTAILKYFFGCMRNKSQ